MFTTEQQQEFYDQSVDEKFSDKVMSVADVNPTNPLKSLMSKITKEFIKIDGINYKHKHMVGRIKNDVQVNENADGIKSLIYSQTRQVCEDVYNSDDQNTEEFIMDNSLDLSFGEPEKPVMCSEKYLKDQDKEVFFKLNFGVIKDTPVNFRVTNYLKDFDSSCLFNLNGAKQKSRFMWEFAGCKPKKYFSNIKRPEKSLIKKHIKSDPIPDLPKTGAKKVVRLTTKKQYFAASELLLDIQEIEELFIEEKVKHLKDRMLTKHNIFNYSKITHIDQKGRVPKDLKFRDLQSSYLKVERTFENSQLYDPSLSDDVFNKCSPCRILVPKFEWKKLRCLIKECSIWILENFLNEEIRMYSTKMIFRLIRPNMKHESQRMLKLCLDSREMWNKTIELPKVPFMDQSIDNFTKGLFTNDEPDNSENKVSLNKSSNLYDRVKRKRWKRLVKQCFKGLKKQEAEGNFQRLNRINEIKHKKTFNNDDLSSVISSNYMNESLRFSNTVSSEESKSETSSGSEIDEILVKPKIIRREGVSMPISEFEAQLKAEAEESSSEETPIGFIEERPKEKKVDITRQRVQIQFSDNTDSDQEELESEYMYNSELLFVKAKNNKPSSGNERSLYNMFYYKNLLIMDDDFNHSLFEIFEPQLDSEKIRLQRSSFYNLPETEYGIEHIMLESNSSQSPKKNIVEDKLSRVKGLDKLSSLFMLKKLNDEKLALKRPINQSPMINKNYSGAPHKNQPGIRQNYKFMHSYNLDKDDTFKMVNDPEDFLKEDNFEDSYETDDNVKNIDTYSEKSDERFTYEAENHIFRQSNKVTASSAFPRKAVFSMKRMSSVGKKLFLSFQTSDVDVTNLLMKKQQDPQK